MVLRQARSSGPRRERFVGEICSFGTASGVRVVIGRWEQSPLGSFADAMIEQADGHRVLVAPRGDVRAYVESIYDFDEVIESVVAVRRGPRSLTFCGGPLDVNVSIARRSRLGWVLRRVPRWIISSRIWPVVTDPIARLVFPGVRTRGRSVGGRETYAATDLHLLDGVTGTWGGDDLGGLAPMDPPVRFGFSSAPRRSSIVGVTTTVLRVASSPSDDRSLTRPAPR